MAGYSDIPLWKKLGYKTGMSAYVEGEPSDYLSLLGLPVDVAVNWLDRAKPDVEFVHLFVTSASKLESKLEFYRERIAPGGAIWVSWPKKRSGAKTDITENAIRDAALPIRLVDGTHLYIDQSYR